MLTDEQKELRRTGIGASEVAILAGCGYKTPIELYWEKTGEREAANLDDNEAVYWGNALESAVADRYMQLNACDLIESTTKIHPQYNYILATPDRIVNGQFKGLEIKTVGSHAIKNWYDANGEVTVPKSYVLQVHQCMSVTGIKYWDLAALFMGQEMKVYSFEYDQEIDELIIELNTKFWKEHVELRIPPSIDINNCGALDLLKKKYDKVIPIQINLDNEWLPYINELDACKAEIKILQAKADYVQARLLDAMKDNEIGLLPDGRCMRRSIVKVPERTQKSYEYVKLSIKDAKHDK